MVSRDIGSVLALVVALTSAWPSSSSFATSGFPYSAATCSAVCPVCPSTHETQSGGTRCRVFMREGRTVGPSNDNGSWAEQ